MILFSFGLNTSQSCTKIRVQSLEVGAIENGRIDQLTSSPLAGSNRNDWKWDGYFGRWRIWWVGRLLGNWCKLDDWMAMWLECRPVIQSKSGTWALNSWWRHPTSRFQYWQLSTLYRFRRLFGRPSLGILIGMELDHLLNQFSWLISVLLLAVGLIKRFPCYFFGSNHQPSSRWRGRHLRSNAICINLAHRIVKNCNSSMIDFLTSFISSSDRQTAGAKDWRRKCFLFRPELVSIWFGRMF